MAAMHLFDADKARRVHLSHFLGHASPESSQSFPASFILPYGYWSSVEKANFFRSLERHSRWNPDLIAEEIGGGKTVADVCSYIELLQRGSASELRPERRRDTYPIAHEVSDEWIEVEETIAKKLCGEEAEWLKSASKRKREEELKEVKNTLRAGHKVPPEDASEDDDGLTEEDRKKRKRETANQEENEAWEERFKIRKKGLAVIWKQEDLLSSLGGRYLKTMYHMVNTLDTAEEEEDPVYSRDLRKGRDTGVKTFSAPDFTLVDVSSVGDHRSKLSLSSQSPDTDEVDNSQIDPSLLALDMAMTGKQSVRHSHPPDKHLNSVASSSKQADLPVPLPSRGSHPELSTVQAPEVTAQSSPSRSSLVDRISEDPPPLPLNVLPPDLSPNSRRRLRKRLWTRRKRALLNGLPASEVSMDVAKLKRGRKAKHSVQNDEEKTKEDVPELQVDLDLPAPIAAARGLSQPSPGPEMSGLPATELRDGFADEDTDMSIDGSKSPLKRHPYGWARLQTLDVNGVSLRTDGLDLFHLEKLTNIMSLLRDVHIHSSEANRIEDSESSEEGLSALSYSLLRLLRACVTHFVTRLVAHVIAHKDVETRQKRRIRDIFQTGGAEEIRAENVHEALMLRGKETSRKPFFKRLRRTVRMAAATEALPDKQDGPHRNTADSDGFVSSDDGSESEDDTSSVGFRPGASRQFDWQSSQAFHPPLDDSQIALALTWNPTVWSTPKDIGEDLLLPENIDEVVMGKDLRAEEKLEEADCEADRIHERNLWMEIGVERDVPTLGVDINQALSEEPKTRPQQQVNIEAGPAQSQSLRFRKPGGAIKSRVYIDSDMDE